MIMYVMWLFFRCFFLLRVTPSCGKHSQVRYILVWPVLFLILKFSSHIHDTSEGFPIEIEGAVPFQGFCKMTGAKVAPMQLGSVNYLQNQFPVAPFRPEGVRCSCYNLSLYL